MNVLKDKSYKDYNYLSRYSIYPYYYHTLDKKYIYGKTTQMKQDSPYTLHKVKNRETLDSLALFYYNNPTLFWVIADFNNIQDPFIKLEVGSYIKIPAIASISFK